MPTAQQVKIIQIARRQVGLDEARYRMLLHNVAGVQSCNDLDNPGVEDVMAVMEGLGFATTDRPADYWRTKSLGLCSERMHYKIRALAGEAGYDADGFAQRMSRVGAQGVEDLDGFEAWKVIEALKAIVDRRTERSA
jgi:phage gp16-like protein